MFNVIIVEVREYLGKDKYFCLCFLEEDFLIDVVIGYDVMFGV